MITLSKITDTEIPYGTVTLSGTITNRRGPVATVTVTSAHNATGERLEGFSMVGRSFEFYADDMK